jgi:hypothetical protein
MAAYLYVFGRDRQPLRALQITKVQSLTTTSTSPETIPFTWTMAKDDAVAVTRIPKLRDEYEHMSEPMHPNIVSTKEEHVLMVELPKPNGVFTMNDRTLILYSVRNMMDLQYINHCLDTQRDSDDVVQFSEERPNPFNYITVLTTDWAEYMNTHYYSALRDPMQSPATTPPIIPHALPRLITESLTEAELLKHFLKALGGEGEGEGEGEEESRLVPYKFVFPDRESCEGPGQCMDLKQILDANTDYTLVAAFYAEGDGVNSLWFDRMDGSRFVPIKIHIAVLRHVMVNDELLVQPSTLRELRLRKLLDPGEEGEDETAKLDRILLLLSETAMYSQMCRHRYSTTTTKG